MEKELTQPEKELLVLQNILNVLQAIEMKNLDYHTFENLVYAKGMLQGFINLKSKNA